MSSLEAPAPTSEDQDPSPSPLSPCPTFIVHVDVDDNDDYASVCPDQDADGGSDRSFCRTAVTHVILAAIAISGIVYAIAYPMTVGEGSREHEGSRTAATDIDLRAQMTKLCAVTDFPEDCISTLSQSHYYKLDRGTIDPVPLAAFSVNVADKAAAGARGLQNNSHYPAALGDCDELLALAHELLLKVRDEIDAFDAYYQDYPISAADVKNALSAAVALEVACAEGFDSGNTSRSRSSVSTISDALRNATMSARISLALVSQIVSTGRGRQQEPATEMQEGELKISWSPANGTMPDVVVASDGSGDVRTITEALKRAASRSSGRFVIYVKAGVYKETVRVTADMAQMTIYGDGPRRTVITGNRSVADGLSYYDTATFAVAGHAFMAKGIRFENTAMAAAGAAAALRVESDLAAFHDCHVKAYHGTLHVVAQRQFFRDCTITGAVDVITGDAAAVLQNCRVALMRPPEGQKAVVAAQARTDCHEGTGIVLQNCSVAVAGGEVRGWRATSSAVLGRAAGECARAVVMETEVGEVVAAEGWAPAPSGGNVYFGEFKNRGTAAVAAGRQEMTSAEEAAKYTVVEFIQGHLWLNATGIPFYSGLSGAT